MSPELGRRRRRAAWRLTVDTPSAQTCCGHQSSRNQLCLAGGRPIEWGRRTPAQPVPPSTSTPAGAWTALKPAPPGGGGGSTRYFAWDAVQGLGSACPFANRAAKCSENELPLHGRMEPTERRDRPPSSRRSHRKPSHNWYRVLQRLSLVHPARAGSRHFGSRPHLDPKEVGGRPTRCAVERSRMRRP